MPNSNRNDEYLMIREEIMHHKQRQNLFSTFACTAVVAILGSSVVSTTPEICLIALLIVLPCALKAFESRYSIALLSTYLKVYLEPQLDIHWETNLSTYYENSRRRTVEKIVYVFSKFDFVLFGLVSSVVYWVLRYNTIKPSLPLEPQCSQIVFAIFDSSRIFVLILQLSIIRLLISLTKAFYDYARLKESKCKNWRDIINKLE